MELRPIKYKKAYEKLIADKITNWLWENVFKGCLDILNSKTIYNDSSIIPEAIRLGKIYYQDGAFYSKTGKFSNTIAKELETIGAKYSKYRNAYLIEKSKIPTEILWSIDLIKAETSAKALLVQQFLTEQLSNLSKEDKKLVFDTAVESIMQDLQKRVYDNANNHKIELITPKLTDFRKNEIAKNYTNNLNFWIKNWLDSENFNNVTIPKMREAVGKMAIEGKSRKDIADYLMKSFNASKRHAEFLARNESAIATTSYLSSKYRDEGFSHFKWITNLDGRERPLHRKLNGQIFAFNNPPIIDEKTGQKGLPAETYNCRCLFTPVVNKEWLENRKKLFKANNSLTARIKKFFNV